MRLRLASFCVAAAFAGLHAAPATAATGSHVMEQDDLDREFQAMIAPAMAFLDLVNTRFPARECVRARSLLNADYDIVARSLLQMFLVRDDLRGDVRELFMRLATFQPLPTGGIDLEKPLAIPPTNEEERQLNAAIVQARSAFWTQLDEVEALYPTSADAARRRGPGLLITAEDRGWRPQAPTNVLHERGGCASA